MFAFVYFNWSNSLKLFRKFVFFFLVLQTLMLYISTETGYWFSLSLIQAKKTSLGPGFIFAGTLTAVKNKHCFSLRITDKYLTELGCDVPGCTVCCTPWAEVESNQIHMHTLICMPFCPRTGCILREEQPFFRPDLICFPTTFFL